LITPMCAKPRAAPPPSARPTRSGRCGLTAGVGGTAAVVGVGATSSGLLPVDAQAERTAEAAAIENVRRDKRGDDGFNEFSCDGADVRVNASRRVSCKGDRRRRSSRAAQSPRAARAHHNAKRTRRDHRPKEPSTRGPDRAGEVRSTRVPVNARSAGIIGSLFFDRVRTVVRPICRRWVRTACVAAPGVAVSRRWRPSSSYRT